MSTAAEIREKALKKLGVKAVGNTTRAEIASDVDAAYAEVYAMLDTMSLTTWDFDEEVPDDVVNPVVWLVADVRKDEYSIPDNRYQRVSIDGNKALPLIRELQASNVQAEPVDEYY